MKFFDITKYLIHNKFFLCPEFMHSNETLANPSFSAQDGQLSTKLSTVTLDA